MEKLVDHILDKHVVTVLLLLFSLVGVEQVVFDDLTYKELLGSLPMALAVAGVAVGRGLAAYRRP